MSRWDVQKKTPANQSLVFRFSGVDEKACY